MDLQNDPRTKQVIKDMLYSHIYDPVEYRLHEKLKLIVGKNRLLNHHEVDCFSYKAKVYTLDGSMMRSAPKLDMSLYGEMQEYLKELNELNRVEIPYVLNFINQALNASNDLRDYLKLLPECLHKPIQELIDAHECLTERLSSEEVEAFRERNANSILMVKKRLLLNVVE
jgi:DNA repair exonuclease SbcCD ATPase subunit